MSRARFLLPMLISLSACDRAPQVHVFTGASMGTTYRIKIVSNQRPHKAGKMIERTLEELEAALSTWRSDSWVSRFNRSRSTDPQPVPEGVWPLLVESLELCDQTDGRFDITLGRLVEAWGFGAHPNTGPAPTDPQIRRLLDQCGYRKLILDASGRRLAKTDPNLALDFSAIAKGYAVDRISERLENLGHHNHLIEFGGDLRLRGAPPGATGWRIAVPGSPEPLVLYDGALATSGPRHQSKNGRSHLIDPRTGRSLPIDGPVTVRAPTAARADALATARAVETAGRTDFQNQTP